MKALLVLAALHLPPMCSKREEAKINATNGRAVLHRLVIIALGMIRLAASHKRQARPTLMR